MTHNKGMNTHAFRGIGSKLVQALFFAFIKANLKLTYL